MKLRTRRREDVDEVDVRDRAARDTASIVSELHGIADRLNELADELEEVHGDEVTGDHHGPDEHQAPRRR